MWLALSAYLIMNSLKCITSYEFANVPNNLYDMGNE